MWRLIVRRGWWILLLLATSAVCEFTPLDFWLQDHFYDFTSHRWWIDGHEPVGRALFYTWPKMALILLGVALLAFLVGPARWRMALAARGWRTDRRRLAIVVLAAGAVPAIVGLLKGVSAVHCPSELIRYGGTADYTRPFMPEVCGGSAGHCWPAGHASGGFALLALGLLASDDRQRTVITGAALVFGWTMGLYQMLKGAHFTSHTVVTMLIAIAVTQCAAFATGTMKRS